MFLRIIVYFERWWNLAVSKFLFILLLISLGILKVIVILRRRYKYLRLIKINRFDKFKVLVDCAGLLLVAANRFIW